MRTAVLALAVVLAAQFGTPPAGAQAPACRLSADFEALRAKITAGAGRDLVGACRETERTLENGDKIQRTKNGVLHWRAKDRTARFTNHTVTWALDLTGLHTAANGVEGHAAVYDRLGFAPGIEYLFVLKSTGGKLTPKPGTDGVFTITLTNPDDQVAWFSDRPQRLSGHRPLATFVDWWDGLGFGAVPPNAVIALPHGKAEQDTLIFTMERPAWDAKAKTLTFQAVRLADDAPHRYEAQRARADKTLPASFGSAVVFVDPGDTLGAGNVATLIDAVVLMATCGQLSVAPGGEFYNGCDNQDLHGRNLSGTDDQTKVGGGPRIKQYGIIPIHKGIATPQFHGANLAGANLTHSGTDDTGPKSAMFNFANLEGANLGYSRWRASQFLNAKAFRADLSHCDLASANFLGADIREVNFTASNLTAAQLTTNAQRANFQNAALVSANFNGADVQGANFTGANLAGPAQFVNANARGAKFRGANLDGVNFYGANLEGADFTGANLTRVQFVTANLTNAILDGATVDWANFDRAKMDGMSFRGRIFHCSSSLFWPGVGLTKWGCQ